MSNQRRIGPGPSPDEEATVQLRQIELIIERVEQPPAVTVGSPVVSALAPAAEAEPEEHTPWSALDRFTDEGEIARGGMGSIHRVLDRHLRRRAARKVLGSKLHGNPHGMAQFVEEAQITGQLDHPNIVPIYDFAVDEHGQPSFFTMKLVRGQSMSQLLHELGEQRLHERNLTRLIDIVLRVCDAISFAHSRHVIHRDLKPPNVMIGGHGQVYVMDWGLAALRYGDRVHALSGDKIVGTPGYMAPEQAWNRVAQFDARTDVYALGGMLYKILTAHPPHRGKSAVATVRAARAGVVEPPQDRAPHLELPPELCRIAMKALAAEPSDRYQSVGELRGELEQVLRGGGWFATRVLPAGSLIIHEGDRAHGAYVLVEGRCDVFKEVDGQRVHLRRMGPGEVFGETALLTDHPRTASVVAVDEVTLKVITPACLDRELGRNSWLKALVQALAERFREADEKLTEVQRRGPTG